MILRQPPWHQTEVYNSGPRSPCMCTKGFSLITYLGFGIALISVLMSSFICSSARLDPIWLMFRGHRPADLLPLNHFLVDLGCLDSDQ